MDPRTIVYIAITIAAVAGCVGALKLYLVTTERRLNGMNKKIDDVGDERKDMSNKVVYKDLCDQRFAVVTDMKRSVDAMAVKLGTVAELTARIHAKINGGD